MIYSNLQLIDMVDSLLTTDSKLDEEVINLYIDILLKVGIILVKYITGVCTGIILVKYITGVCKGASGFLCMSCRILGSFEPYRCFLISKKC